MKIYKKRFLSYLIQPVLFIGLISCLTPIDFPVEIAGGKLVVSGQISTIADQNVIQLAVTANVERLPFPVSGASIVLFDTTGDSLSYIEDILKPGRYVLSGAAGVPERTYHIKITLRNGKVYESLPEKMPTSTLLDSVFYEIVKEDAVDAEGAIVKKTFIKIYADANTPKNLPYLKWSVEETFLLTPTDFPDIAGFVPPPCFITQNADPQRITLFDASTVTATSLQGVLTASREIDWTFLERHYFTVYQSSLSAESYQYWSRVKILNQVGSIFDTPPATITGNIVNVNDPSEKIIGFFQATNQTYSRFFVHSSDLSFPLLVEKCDFDGSFNPNDYPQRCFNCENVLNSSFNRPFWF